MSFQRDRLLKKDITGSFVKEYFTPSEVLSKGILNRHTNDVHALICKTKHRIPDSDDQSVVTAFTFLE